MNQCNFTGNFVADPEVRYSADGKPVTNFRMGVKDWRAKEPVFIRCVAFAKTAELISEHCRKGSGVRITAAFQERSWTDKEGQKRWSSEFIVNDFEFLDSPNQRNQQDAKSPSDYVPPTPDMGSVPF